MVRYIAETEEDFQTIQEPSPVGYLTLVTDGRLSHSFPLRGMVQMGREKGNAIVVADQKVSRHHATLSPIDNAFIITDQGSANGTYINGVLIAQPTRLKDNDRINLGDTTFLFTNKEPQQNAVDAPLAAASSPRVTSPPVGPGTASSTFNMPSIWMLLGCMALVIVALLFFLAVLMGLLIGRADFIGLLG